MPDPNKDGLDPLPSEAPQPARPAGMPPIERQADQLRQFDNHSLQLWVRTAETNGQLVHTPPEAINRTRPTLVVLPGMMVSHAHESQKEKAVGMALSQLGAKEVPDNMQVVIATYPDFFTARDDFLAYSQNNIASPHGKYSPISMDIAKQLVGDVKDFSRLAEGEQQAEIQRLQKELRQKVLFGYSQGSIVAEGIQNATAEVLAQHHFPPEVIREQVMPHMKIVTIGELGVMHRAEGVKSQGATSVHVLNASDKAPKRFVAGFDETNDVRNEGTVIARVDDNAAFVTTNVPERFIIEEKYDPSKPKHAEIPEHKRVLVERDGVTYLQRPVFDDGGHGLDSYTKPVKLLPADQGHYSNTEVTGHIPGNALRAFMHDAVHASALPDGQPMPAPLVVQDAIATPSPSITHSGDPALDTKVKELASVGYSDHVRGVTSAESPTDWRVINSGEIEPRLPYIAQSRDNALAALKSVKWQAGVGGDGEIFLTPEINTSEEKARVLGAMKTLRLAANSATEIYAPVGPGAQEMIEQGMVGDVSLPSPEVGKAPEGVHDKFIRELPWQQRVVDGEYVVELDGAKLTPEQRAGLTLAAQQGAEIKIDPNTQEKISFGYNDGAVDLVKKGLISPNNQIVIRTSQAQDVAPEKPSAVVDIPPMPVVESGYESYLQPADSARQPQPTQQQRSQHNPTDAEGYNYHYISERHGREYQEDRFLLEPTPGINDAQAKELLEKTTTALTNATSSHMRSGSTFTGAIITESGNVVTAHLGDSPAAAIIYDPKTGKAEAVRLTTDHKPSDSYKEFERNGSSWYEKNGRIYVEDSALAMSRALGDGGFGDAVSKEADINVHDLSEHHRQGKKVFLLVASDGALNEKRNVTLELHAETVAKHLNENPNASLADISRNIVTNSRSIRDNITVTLTEITPGKSAIVSVFDGHGGELTSQTALDKMQKVVSDVKEKGVDVTISTLEKLNSTPMPETQHASAKPIAAPKSAPDPQKAYNNALDQMDPARRKLFMHSFDEVAQFNRMAERLEETNPTAFEALTKSAPFQKFAASRELIAGLAPIDPTDRTASEAAVTAIVSRYENGTAVATSTTTDPLTPTPADPTPNQQQPVQQQQSRHNPTDAQRQQQEEWLSQQQERQAALKQNLPEGEQKIQPQASAGEAARPEPKSLKPPPPPPKPVLRPAIPVTESAPTAEAIEAANQFRQQLESLPPVEPGHVRVYRGESADHSANLTFFQQLEMQKKATRQFDGRWFTDSVEAAVWYMGEYGGSNNTRIKYVDIPEAEARQYHVSKDPQALRFSRAPEEEYILPQARIDQAKTAVAMPGTSIDSANRNSAYALVTQYGKEHDARQGILGTRGRLSLPTNEEIKARGAQPPSIETPIPVQISPEPLLLDVARPVGSVEGLSTGRSIKDVEFSGGEFRSGTALNVMGLAGGTRDLVDYFSNPEAQRDYLRLGGNATVIASSATGIATDLNMFSASRTLEQAKLGGNAAAISNAETGLMRASTLSRNVGLVTSGIMVPLDVYKATNAFREGDYYTGSQHVAGATSGTLMAVSLACGSTSRVAAACGPAGLVVAIGAQTVDIGVKSYQIYEISKETAALSEENLAFDKHLFKPNIASGFVDKVKQFENDPAGYRMAMPEKSEYKSLARLDGALGMKFDSESPSPETMLTKIDAQIKIWEAEKAKRSEVFSDKSQTVMHVNRAGMSSTTTYPSERENAQTPEGREKLLSGNAVAHTYFGQAAKEEYDRKIAHLADADDKLRILKAARIEITGDKSGLVSGVPSYQSRYDYAKAGQEMAGKIPQLETELAQAKEDAKSNAQLKDDVARLRGAFEEKFGEKIADHPDYENIKRTVKALQEAHEKTPGDKVIHGSLLNAQTTMLKLERQNLEYVEASLASALDKKAGVIATQLNNKDSLMLEQAFGQQVNSPEVMLASNRARQASASFSQVQRDAQEGKITQTELLLGYIGYLSATNNYNTAREESLDYLKAGLTQGYERGQELERRTRLLTVPQTSLFAQLTPGRSSDNTIRPIILGGSGEFAATGSSLAAQPINPFEVILEKQRLDVNRNGVIDTTDVAFMKKEDIDKNRDGKVDRQEFANFATVVKDPEALKLAVAKFQGQGIQFDSQNISSIQTPQLPGISGFSQTIKRS